MDHETGAAVISLTILFCIRHTLSEEDDRVAPKYAYSIAYMGFIG